MKIILLPATTLIFLVTFLIGWQLLFNDRAYVIGGTYVIRDGETVKHNLNLIFAQFELERGGRVNGRILSFSSVLDLDGAVAGEILSIGSDIDVKENAQLRDMPRALSIFPYVILLPQMARIGAGPDTYR